VTGRKEDLLGYETDLLSNQKISLIDIIFSLINGINTQDYSPINTPR